MTERPQREIGETEGRRERGERGKDREGEKWGTVVCVGFIEAKTNEGVEFVCAEKV